MKTTKFSYFIPMVCLLVLSAIGCTKSNIEVPITADELKSEAEIGLTTRGGGNPVIHHVSAGGADICIDYFGTHPGCNGNFSLVANMKADGSVSGQFTDQFGHGDGGFHATVDCMTIVGNAAWISGVITSGSDGNGVDYTGLPVRTKVVDNGQSGDEVGFSYIGSRVSCNVKPRVPVFEITGQVKVW